MKNDIQKTMDFDKFKFSPGNREVWTSHVNKLVKSILRQNLLNANPILVTSDFTVIDGQHRLAAASKIGIPIYYIVIRGNLDTVRQLNTYQRMWSTADYLDSYIANGEEEYVKLKEFVEKWDIGISFAAGMLSGKIVRDGGLRGDCVRDGTFKCLYWNEADELMTWVDAFSQYADVSVRRNRSFMAAVGVVKATGIVTLPELTHKINVWARPIVRYNNKADNLRQLEEILNYHSKEKQRYY